MALNINGRMKVKTLKQQFKENFGLTLRLYDGRSFADDEATLASVRKGDSKGGEYSPRRNTQVGNFEDKLMEMFGIKSQVAGSDDSYLCKNELTLAAALDEDNAKMERKDKKIMKNQENNNLSNSDIGSEIEKDDINYKYLDVTTDLVTLDLFVFDFFEAQLQEWLENEGYDDIEECDEEEKQMAYNAGFYNTLYELKYSLETPFRQEVSEYEGIYVKVNGSFLNLENLDDIDWSDADLNGFGGDSITLYFVLPEPMELSDSHFFHLSKRLPSEAQVSYFNLIVELKNGLYIYQGYENNDYEEGFFSDEDEDCMSSSDNFLYSNALAKKSDIIS